MWEGGGRALAQRVPLVSILSPLRGASVNASDSVRLHYAVSPAPDSPPLKLAQPPGTCLGRSHEAWHGHRF